MWKRIKIYMLGVLLSVLVCEGQQVALQEVNNTRVPAFIQKISKAYDLEIIYKPEWISDKRVVLTEDIEDLDDALRILKYVTKLSYVWYNDNTLVLYPGSSINEKLPNFDYSDAASSSAISNHKTQAEQRYLEGRTYFENEVVEIGKSNGTKQKRLVNINLKLVLEESVEPVIGATLFIEELGKGAVSNFNGTIPLALYTGEYQCQIRSVGLKAFDFLLAVNGKGSQTIKLQKQVININELTVKAKQYQNVSGVNVGKQHLKMKDIKQIPVLLGESDVIKVAQMLPGIVSVGEGSAGINVRGSNADQNLFLINRIPIYNTAHLFGFFSAFNSSVIKDFTIHKAHIPAQYGGRASSVFNIEPRRGNKNDLFAKAGISPIAANVLLEGPIEKGKSTYMFSARSTYSDYLLRQLDDPDLRNSNAGFQDYTGSMHFDINDKLDMGTFLYHSKDNFKLSDINQYDYANTGANIYANYKLNDGLLAHASIIYSTYNFSTKDESSPTLAYGHSYQINDYSLLNNYAYTFNTKQNMEFGIENHLYTLQRGTVRPYGEQSNRVSTSLGNEKANEFSLYFSDTYTPNDWLTLYGGFRYSFYSLFGPSTQLSYQDNAPRIATSVTDSTIIGSSNIAAMYHFPEFRFSSNFKLNSDNSIKLAFNQSHQNLFMLSNTVSIAPNDQWKLADAHVKPQKSNQLSLGFYSDALNYGYTFSVEGYYKQTNNALDYRDGADFISNRYVEQATLTGKQQAYGIEFFLRRTSGRLNGWLSYAYARSKMNINEDPFNQINNGAWYPSNYDLPHVANTVVNYHVNRRLTLSGNMVYQSGKPITYPTGIYYSNGMRIIDYSSRNEYRIPDYFRFDVSIALEGNLKRNKLAHSSWLLSVYNATGRSNPYSVYFKLEDGVINGYKYAVVGVPIVTLSWIIKLGNYVNE